MKTNPSSPPRVTLRDIARKLAISHVTVSLALRDHPRISEDRRNQIKDAARAMGYRPDPMLTALSHYRHSRMSVPVQATIAWLNFWPDPKQLRSYREFDAYWRGAARVAESHGYRLEEFAPSSRMPLSRIEQVLLTRNVRGILLPPVPSQEAITAQTLRWDEFAIVRFGHSSAQLPVHVVTSDQVAACRLAFERVAERGYKRIGFAMRDNSNAHTLFSAGYLQAQLQVPVHDQLPILVMPSSNLAAWPQLLKAWYAEHRPDALITQLAEARQILTEIGVRVPEDLSLAALSVLDGNADAGIDQNGEEIGRAAAETLISLINHNHRGIPEFQRQILVEGIWVDGSTLPDRRLTATPGKPAKNTKTHAQPPVGATGAATSTLVPGSRRRRSA